jgi:hypothetical protein
MVIAINTIHLQPLPTSHLSPPVFILSSAFGVCKGHWEAEEGEQHSCDLVSDCLALCRDGHEPASLPSCEVGALIILLADREGN